MGKKKKKKEAVSRNVSKHSKKKKRGNQNESGVKPVGGPVVYLVRHGKSKGQDAEKKGKDRMSTEFLDVKLANSGVDQAKFLNSWLQDLAPPAIFISPLTRCIQTYTYMRNRTDFPTVCTAVPGLSELSKSHVPENIGRPLAKIQNDWVVTQIEEPFNEIDFNRIENETEWWNCAKPKPERHERFQEILREISQMDVSHVVIVCHYNVIRKITSPKISRPSNCTPYKCQIVSLGDELALQLFEDSN